MVIGSQISPGQLSLPRELKWFLGIHVPNQEKSSFLLIPEDEEIICSVQTRKSDASNYDKIQLFNENKEYGLVHAVEEGLINPPRSDVNIIRMTLVETLQFKAYPCSGMVLESVT